MKKLFEGLEENDIVVTGNGSACAVSFQAAEIKKVRDSLPIPDVPAWAMDCRAMIRCLHCRRRKESHLFRRRWKSDDEPSGTADDPLQQLQYETVCTE